MSQISQIKKIYHAAIYVRLSKEDGAVASHEKTESNSIANQKSLIRDFLENKNDIEVVQEYVDDGFSGSNFERPAFQMMLEDIKKGKIDCVVTKDLSRFGREYIDSGMYIERLFPAMGVRFIAINDGIDSGEAKSQSDEIIIPFKNLINDAYCRDISIKIRSHLEIKRKQGDVITAFVPYGYKKNDKDKHKLEIDVYAANVVKDIFRMKLHGKSQDAIACELNSSGILPPAEYKASTGSNYQTCFKTKEKSEWTSVMVRRILTNEVYVNSKVPIIMLTARGDERDELQGFQLGVDEYISKPFSPKILVARVEAILRRTNQLGQEAALTCGGITVDKAAHRVIIDGKDVDLSYKEFELLTYFMENKGIALSREKILNNVWNYDYFGDARTIDTHVKKLRSKLGEEGNLIKTIWGMGYKMDETAE